MARSIRVNKSGFTLMEMLVTISIFSLMLTIVMPNISSWYSSIRLKGSLRNLISDARLAQQHSVTTQTNYILRINTTTGIYQLIKTNGGETVIKTVNLPSGISFFSLSLNPASTDIEFNSVGVPNTSGTISLKDAKGNTKSLEISPSGFVKEL